MGFIGLLRLLAVLFCIWMLWRFVRKKTAGSHQSTGRPNNGSMVACEVCGTHVPEDKAISANDRWYCSTEHRDQGQA